MEEALARSFHFIGIFGLFAALVSEHLLIKPEMSKPEMKKLAIVDSIYGLSAITILVAGLLLWFVVGKPAEFYSQNPVFHAKLTLFVLIAVLSVYPTVFFIKNRNPHVAITKVPRKIIILIRIQLMLVLVIPFLATTMAKGFGLS
jgi:putative membrane protein